MVVVVLGRLVLMLVLLLMLAPKAQLTMALARAGEKLSVLGRRGRGSPHR